MIAMEWLGIGRKMELILARCSEEVGGNLGRRGVFKVNPWPRGDQLDVMIIIQFHTH